MTAASVSQQARLAEVDAALPSELSPIGADFVYDAPPIPSSVRESLSAWWKARPRLDAAHAELSLYRSTGYFQGATVGNASCPAPSAADFGDGKGLAQGLESLRSSSTSTGKDGSASSTWWPFKRDHEPETMTIASTPAQDGKVGCIRMVDLGPAANSNSPLSKLKAHFADESGSGSGSGQDSSTSPGHPPSGRKLNMLEIGLPYSPERQAEIESETKIVLLHGYGAGTAFFFQNLSALAQVPNSRLYALDWLGMGRSSRPTFHIPSSQTKTVEARVEAAESFFVDSLEDWRKRAGVDKMVVVGHSLGGYLSLAYALRYPERVQRLVLVSPVGIPHGPDEGRNKSPNPNPNTNPNPEVKAGVEAELSQPQTDVAPHTRAEQDSDARAARHLARQAATSNSRSATSVEARTSTSTADDQDKTPQPPRFSKSARAVFGFLWEQNISPFGVLRSSLFFGPLLAGRYTSRRFGALPDEKLRSLHAYCQSIFLSRGSGEYCLAHLLAPGAYARRPMVDRIAPLARAGIPVSFMYGEHDWMDVQGGRKSVQILRQAHPDARATCFVLPRSGHHLYLDNPAAFDALLSKIIRGQADTGSYP